MIIHDLSESEADILHLGDKEKVICEVSDIKSCIRKDDYKDMGKIFKESSELIIISECCYGGYSSDVKKILDKSMLYMLPRMYFKNSRMFHKKRYKNNLKMSVYFYGDNITDLEKKTAVKLIHANAENLGCSINNIIFLSKKEMMEGKYNEYWSY